VEAAQDTVTGSFPHCYSSYWVLKLAQQNRNRNTESVWNMDFSQNIAFGCHSPKTETVTQRVGPTRQRHKETSKGGNRPHRQSFIQRTGNPCAHNLKNTRAMFSVPLNKTLKNFSSSLISWSIEAVFAFSICHWTEQWYHDHYRMKKIQITDGRKIICISTHFQNHTTKW